LSNSFFLSPAAFFNLRPCDIFLLLNKSVGVILNSAEAIDSGSARAILPTRASLDQRNLYLKITNGLKYIFFKARKKAKTD
jgi:hypothetical protein